MKYDRHTGLTNRVNTQSQLAGCLVLTTGLDTLALKYCWSNIGIPGIWEEQIETKSLSTRRGIFTQ